MQRTCDGDGRILHVGAAVVDHAKRDFHHFVLSLLDSFDDREISTKVSPVFREYPCGFHGQQRNHRGYGYARILRSSSAKLHRHRSLPLLNLGAGNESPIKTHTPAASARDYISSRQAFLKTSARTPTTGLANKLK